MRVQDLLAVFLPGSAHIQAEVQEAYAMIYQCGLTDQAEDIVAAARELYRSTDASWTDCVREVVKCRLLPNR